MLHFKAPIRATRQQAALTSDRPSKNEYWVSSRMTYWYICTFRNAKLLRSCECESVSVSASRCTTEPCLDPSAARPKGSVIHLEKSLLLANTTMASSVANISSSRLRKGTFSCWECKKRKRRCDLGTRSAARACSWCRHRELDCIGQDQSDPGRDNYSDARSRLDKIESLALSVQRQSRSNRHCPRPTQLSAPNGPVRLCVSPSDLLPPLEARKGRCRQLGEYVFSILPPQDTIETITVRGRSAFRQHLGIRDDWSDSMKDSIFQPYYLLLAARKLYQLALCLRQMQAGEQECMALGLDGSSHEVANRFVEAANHVTSQDFLVQSTQGLEILMMQAYCRIYIGDAAGMRPILHRALTYGRIMGLNEATDAANEELWFRVVYAERFLSLGLGMQPFDIDDSFASDTLVARSKVTRRLERIHVLIAGRLIDRNLRMCQSNAPSHDTKSDSNHETTQVLDRQLKHAARCVPTNWWLLPTWDDPSHETMMESFTHVLTGLHHYYLLLLIHQPYILGDSRTSSGGTLEYSKQASINASREILSRSVFFNRFSYLPCSFVGMAQKTFAAAIALLVLHMKSQQLGQHENVLEHQRPQDLCLIESILPTIEEIFESAGIASGYGDVCNLRKLMELEGESAYGIRYSICMEPCSSSSQTGDNSYSDATLRIPVPYHGQICIECRN